MLWSTNEFGLMEWCMGFLSNNRLWFQVGAALSMVYVSGAPVVFVGCGQTYTDLKRLNVKSIIKSLLH